MRYHKVNLHLINLHLIRDTTNLWATFSRGGPVKWYDSYKSCKWWSRVSLATLRIWEESSGEGALSSGATRTSCGIDEIVVSLRNRTAERRGRQIACAWRTWQGYNLRILLWSWLTSMFSGLLQNDLFKRKWSLAKSYFKQNYCYACHTRFAVFFPLPSCCVSSLVSH